MKDHFLILARASAWANDLLGAELARLSPPQWAHASAANFGSLQGIANHLVLADRVWLQRFSGQGEPVSTPISTVDAVPHPDIPGCLAARRVEDQRVIAFAEALDPARLGATLRYTAMNGSPAPSRFPCAWRTSTITKPSTEGRCTPSWARWACAPRTWT